MHSIVKLAISFNLILLVTQHPLGCVHCALVWVERHFGRGKCLIPHLNKSVFDDTVENGFVSVRRYRLPPTVHSTDKMADYLIPPGADVEGSPMHAHWTNYKRLADLYVGGNDDSFMFVPYVTQQSYNEQGIQNECSRIGEDEEMRNVYRQYYNQWITKFRKTQDQADLENALEYLENFKQQDVDTGTLVADDDYGKCTTCNEDPRIGEYTELCADCYWSEDSYLKSMRRNAIPSSGNAMKSWKEFCDGMEEMNNTAYYGDKYPEFKKRIEEAFDDTIYEELQKVLQSDVDPTDALKEFLRTILGGAARYSHDMSDMIPDILDKFIQAGAVFPYNQLFDRREKDDIELELTDYSIRALIIDHLKPECAKEYADWSKIEAMYWEDAPEGTSDEEMRLIAGEIAGGTGVGHNQRDAAVALGEQVSAGVTADRAVIDVQGGQLDVGMARTEHEAGEGVGGEPILQVVTDRGEQAAEDSVATKEVLQTATRDGGCLRRTDEHLGGEAVLGEMSPHLADDFVGGDRELLERHRAHDPDEAAGPVGRMAGGGEQTVAATLPDLDHATLREHLQRGPDRRPAYLQELAEAALAGEKVLPRALADGALQRFRGLSGQRLAAG